MFAIWCISSTPVDTSARHGGSPEPFTAVPGNQDAQAMKSQDIFSAETARGWLPWGAFAPVLGLLFLIASELVGGPILELPEAGCARAT
jgi:hypothetical protein